MGQGSCSKEGAPCDSNISVKSYNVTEPDRSEFYYSEDTNNNNRHPKELQLRSKMPESEARRIAELEQLLKQKDAEIQSYQKSLESMPDWSKVQGQICLRNQESTCVLMQSYKPKTVGDKRRQLEDYVRDLTINNDHISEMEKRMRSAITKGLKKETHQQASVKCFPTYVRDLPSGHEHGQFLALDLGGTNFRVVLMEIGECGKFEMDSEVYAISKDLMEGTGSALFDHIASCLAKFVHTRKIQDKNLPLGFTFSFPCRQKGLAVGELITWTKGFKCAGVEGEDVVSLLMEAIKKRDDVNVDIAAILNDTTGCLMSCAWKNPKCRIGLIIGTGTNACYLEELDNVELWDGDSNEPKHMIVNTEWGAFGDHGELDFIQTKWDKRVDEGSINPGKQVFEKMISGMYMGEVVRQVLVDLVNEGLIFNGCNTKSIFERGRFYTKYVSEIESDQVGEFTRCRQSLKDLNIEDPSDEDCSSMRYVCEKVSRRAGFMVAAGITALLKKMNYKDVVVAIDGSVFRFHPHFPNIMKSRISQLMGIDYKFDLMLSTDGSGRGAALVAATLLGQCAI